MIPTVYLFYVHTGREVFSHSISFSFAAVAVNSWGFRSSRFTDSTGFVHYRTRLRRKNAHGTFVFRVTPLSPLRAYDEIRMCLAIPGKIVEFHENQGVRMSKVDFGGITREACLEYIPDAKLGDYVMVHVGFAISKVDEEEAARTYQYLAELGQLTDINSPDIDTVEETPDEVP